MATRPSITIDIRAENDTWDGTAPVPLQGQDTKIPPNPVKTSNGWNGDEKPGAQEFNFYNNRNDQWVFWMTEASALALEVPHLKEANATGNTAFASVTAGGTTTDEESISVTPNSGSGETGLFASTGSSKNGSVFETTSAGLSAILARSNGATTVGDDNGIIRVESTSNGQTGINVVMASTAPGIDVTNTEAEGPCVRAQAGPGDDSGGEDGGPAIYGLVGAPDGSQVGGLAGHFQNIFTSGITVLMETTSAGANADVLVINGANRSVCINATQQGGKRPAARFEAGHDSGHSSAPIQLIPQLDDMLGDGLTNADGSIWIKEGFFNGDTQHHPRFFSGASGQSQKWLPWTNGPTCAIDKYLDAAESGDTTDAYYDIFNAALLDFDTDAIPLDTGVVIINVSGYVFRTSDGADIIANDGAAFRLTDTTAGGAPVIYTRNFDLMPKRISPDDDENKLAVYFRAEFEYTLPATGQRVFLAEMARAPGSVSGSLSTSYVKFSVRPRA